MKEINYDKRWKIVRTIGHGAFGTVYEIARKDFGETFHAALKVISIPQSEDEMKSNLASGMNEQSMATYYESCVEELRNEFSILSKMKGHTNIVSYEDHQVVPHDDGIGWDIYIRMELLTSLTTFLSKKTLSRNQVVKLGIDLCQALSFCEKKNIIHRDIKPDNIFISDEGDFKLGDFGIARTASKTLSNMSRKGTPNYMAPEIFKNEPYNHTVDIYSLGIVLYQLMNGKRLPFVPENMTIQDRENALGKRMSGVNLPAPEKCDFPFASIILRACAYRPEDRYQSADDMMQDLQTLLNGQKVDSLDISEFVTEEKPEENVKKKHPDNLSPVDSGNGETTFLGDERNDPERGQAEIHDGQYGSVNSETGQPKKVRIRAVSDWNSDSGQHNEIGENGKNRKPKNKLAILITAIIGVAAVAICAIIISTKPVSRKTDTEADSVESKASNSAIAQMRTDKKTTSSKSISGTSSVKPASEAETTATDAGTVTQLSDNLRDYTFELKGHVYHLPLAYTDFIKNGFKLDDFRVKEDTTIGGMSYVSVKMTEGSTGIFADIYNPSGSDKTLKECYIGGISATDIKVAKGMSSFNTPEEIIGAFGQPYSDDTDNKGNYRRITYQDTDDAKSGLTAFSVPLTGDNSYANVLIQHMVAIEGASEDVSADRPEYLDTYKAPEKMDASETSTDITIEGKIYRIPCPLNEFTDSGWKVSKKEMESIPSGRKEGDALTLTKGKKMMIIGMKNFESTEQLIENCAVYSVNFYNLQGASEISFKSGAGITGKTSKEEAVKMLPNFEKTESSDSVSLTYENYSNDSGRISIRYGCITGGKAPSWSITISKDQWPYS